MTHEPPRPRTHGRLDGRLCGRPVELAAGRSRVEMTARPETAADEHGPASARRPSGERARP